MQRKEFWDTTGKILLVIALVVGCLSLFLNLTSNFLEKKSETSVPSVYIPEEQISVTKVLTAGEIALTNPSLTQDYTGTFEGINQILPNYDITMMNQVNLVGSQISDTIASDAVNSGFDTVSLANPNSLANGAEGIDTSLSFWEEQGIVIAGTNRSSDAQHSLPVFYSGNISIISLAFTESITEPLPDAQPYLVNVYDSETTPEMIRKAAQSADVVLVSIYWQGEDLSMPSEHQQEIAKSLADAGASIIVGVAPRAVQPVAWIDDTLVFYSLGTLAGDSGNPYHRIGVLGAVDITKTVTEGNMRIELTNPRVDVVMTILDDTGLHVRLFEELTSAEFPNKDAVYTQYQKALQQMDDSIRIGGLK